MPTPCFLLNRLDPTDLLRVLAEMGPDVGELAALDVRVESDVDGARLVVPDPSRSADPARSTHAVGKLLEAIGRLFTLEQSSHPMYQHESLPAVGASVWALLLQSRSSHVGAETIDCEHLLVATDFEAERLASVFARLSRDCTDLRVATTRDGGERDHTLFYVRDDVTRVSGFAALRASGALSGITILDAFAADCGTIFLPSDRPPSERALELFGSIATAAPQLLDPRQLHHQPRHGLFAAVRERRDASPSDAGRDPNHCDVLLLGAIELRHKSGLAAHEGISVSLHRLQTSPLAEEKLAAAIQASTPPIGYMLSLRPGPPVGGTTIEIERLQEQVNALEERKAYLRGITSPRPTLFRFRQSQLSALADVVRRFPVSMLGNDGLRYGFQANTKHAPDGVHYLLVDPDLAVADQLFPEWLWRDPHDPPLAFWLDPFWSAHYHRTSSKSLVFVPRRLALYPPLHSWDRGDMDDYLRNTVAAWSSSAGSAGWPESPIYLFDGPYGPDETIRIEVLDQAGFVPLGRRLGWLNQNLELLEAIDSERLLAQMASDASRTQLSDSFARSTKVAERRLRRAAERLNEVVAVELGELSAVMSAESEAVVASIQNDLLEIERLHQQFDEVATMLRELGALDKTRDDSMRHLHQLSKSFRDRRGRIAREVQEVLLEADRELAEVKRKLDRVARTDAQVQELRRRSEGG